MSSLPPLVLEILPPATLAFALLSSLAAFAFLHHSFRSKPALSLPTHDRDDDESAYRASHAQTEQEIKDPFNLYDPIVSFLDGTPIDPDRFWSGLVRFKLPVLVGSVLLLLIASVDLTSPLTNIPSSSSTNPTAWGLVDQLARWTVYGLTTWLAWLSLSYVEGDVPSHWRLTLHLASLFGTALVVRGLQVLLPREKHLEQEHQHRHRDSSTDHGKLAAVVDWLPFAEVGLLLVRTECSANHKSAILLDYESSSCSAYPHPFLPAHHHYIRIHPPRTQAPFPDRTPLHFQNCRRRPRARREAKALQPQRQTPLQHEWREQRMYRQPAHVLLRGQR